VLIRLRTGDHGHGEFAAGFLCLWVGVVVHALIVTMTGWPVLEKGGTAQLDPDGVLDRT
jgi:hypothetical protein